MRRRECRTTAPARRTNAVRSIRLFESLARPGQSRRILRGAQPHKDHGQRGFTPYLLQPLSQIACAWMGRNRRN
nr:MAG TPA: hypothetical protein [Caudoviricetes sp.]